MIDRIFILNHNQSSTSNSLGEVVEDVREKMDDEYALDLEELRRLQSFAKRPLVLSVISNEISNLEKVLNRRDKGMGKRRERYRPPNIGQLPWLVYPCGEFRRYQLFCTIPSTVSNYVEQKSIPELRGEAIWASLHGWLLVYDTKNKEKMFPGTEISVDFLLLWNPITLESISLPPLFSRPKNIGSSLFTSSPKNPGCTVLLFDNDSPVILYTRPGDNHWIKHDYGTEFVKMFGEEFSDATIYDIGCLNGVLYAASSDGRPMISLEIDDQGCLNFRNLDLNIPFSEQEASCFQLKLVASFGELYAVFFSFQGGVWDETIGIELFRLDFNQMVWVKIECLQDRLLFLGDDRCTSCSSIVAGVEGNKIYYLIPEDKHLYVYDLEYNRISVSLPCPTLKYPWYQPVWVMPDLCEMELEVEARLETINEGDKVVDDMEVDTYGNDEEACFRYLHLDMFTAVARHLKPVDYLHFRAACRLFQSAAPPIKFSANSISLRTQFSSPLLITFKNGKSVFRLIDPKQQDMYFINVPESLVGTYICCSKDGHLALAGGGSLFLFNPFTKKLTQFPFPENSVQGFTFIVPPSCSDYLVVMIDVFRYKVLVSFIYTGQDTWTYLEYDNDTSIFTPNYHGPVAYNGKVYCLGELGNLGVFTLDVFGHSWEVLDKPKVPCTAFESNYLAECDGELMAVFVGHFGKWVKVFRLDWSKMQWVRVNSLGSYMLFLSSMSSFSAIAVIPGMENKVYFPRFHGQSIVYYSLDSRKFHTHGSSTTMDSFCNTSQQLYCGWIVPRGSQD